MIRIYFAVRFTSYERKFIDECALKLRMKVLKSLYP